MSATAEEEATLLPEIQACNVRINLVLRPANHAARTDAFVKELLERRDRAEERLAQLPANSRH